MFRKLLKNKKAQNTAEYAILIALVVAGIVAMQTYAQRALQARVRDAAQYLQEQSYQLGNTLQYEPYYQTTNYIVERISDETQTLGNEIVRKTDDSNTTRRVGGATETSYNEDLFNLEEGGI